MRKYICFILIILLLTSNYLLTYPSANAELSRKYVALGDSISFGYNIDEENKFVKILAGTLSLPYTNFSVPGDDSNDLLTFLNSLEDGSDNYNELADASLITVTIGSNDLLGVVVNILMEQIGSVTESIDAQQILQLIMRLVSEDVQAQYDEGVEKYRTNLPLIYERLREINDDAQIIMTNFYNPFYEIAMFNFASFADSYIVKLNNVLNEGNSTMDYTIANVYDGMNARGVTLMNLAAGMPDPHPSVTGHDVFYRAIYDVVDKQNIDRLCDRSVVYPTLSPTATPAPSPSATPDSVATANPTATAKPASGGGVSRNVVIIAGIGAVLVVAIVLVVVLRRRQVK